ncbi:hypothetical protein ACOME3_000589 [Neoechinorhynchus agilis]
MCRLRPAIGHINCEGIFDLSLPMLYTPGVTEITIRKSDFIFGPEVEYIKDVVLFRIIDSNITVNRRVLISPYLRVLEIQDSDVDIFQFSLMVRKNYSGSDLHLTLIRINRCINMDFIKTDYLQITRVRIEQSNHCLVVPQLPHPGTLLKVALLDEFRVDQNSYDCEALCKSRKWVSQILELKNVKAIIKRKSSVKLKQFSFSCQDDESSNLRSLQCPGGPFVNAFCKLLNATDSGEVIMECIGAKNRISLLDQPHFAATATRLHLIECSVPLSVINDFPNVQQLVLYKSNIYPGYQDVCKRRKKLIDLYLGQTYIHLFLMTNYLHYRCNNGPLTIRIYDPIDPVTLSFILTVRVLVTGVGLDANRNDIQEIPSQSTVIIQKSDNKLNEVYLNNEVLTRFREVQVNIYLESCDCKRFSWLNRLANSVPLKVECSGSKFGEATMFKLDEACRRK